MQEGSEKGFFIGIKGGNNDESHNHNDIGCPYVYLDGEPVVIDAGAGTYTIKTFSPERYDIWTMQSGWHSLPEINGFAQQAGVTFKSMDFKWGDDGGKAWASMNISGAYPSEAGIESYTRKISLDRFKENVRIEDDIKLYEIGGESLFHLLLNENPENAGPGIIEVKSGNKRVLIEYDSDLLQLGVEEKDLSADKKLYDSWGNTIYRLNFTPLVQSTCYYICFQICKFAGE